LRGAIPQIVAFTVPRLHLRSGWCAGALAFRIAHQNSKYLIKRAERFLKVAGLFGHIAANDPAVAAGIIAENGKWRLAADNATTRAAGATCGEFVAMTRAPFQLFCGGRDPLVKVEDLRAYDPQAFAVGECGHNPHIEAPDEVSVFNEKGRAIALAEKLNTDLYVIGGAQIFNEFAADIEAFLGVPGS